MKRIPTWSVVGVAVLGAGIGLWLKIRANRRPNTEIVQVVQVQPAVQRPLVSLVLLLDKPLELTCDGLASLASVTWEADIATETVTSQSLEGGVAYTLRLPDQQFLVNTFKRPYVDDAREHALKFADPRCKSAMRSHTAWVSVDLITEGQPSAAKGAGSQPCDDTALAYQRIGRLIAELATDSCLAIYSPQRDRMVPFESGCKAALRGENPLAMFASATTQPGDVQDVTPGDAKMTAATAEARRRWNEFATAFTARKEGQSFCVAAPFTEGDVTEVMWVEVRDIEGSEISGVLADRPVQVRSPREGQGVRVRIADVADWEYTVDDKIVGGFTR